MKKLIVILCLCGLSAGAQTMLVLPYLQPGNAPTFSKEMKVIIWQTDSVPGTFKVEFGEGKSLENTPKLMTAKVTSVELKLRGKTTILYRATLSGLQFDTEYTYQVSMGSIPISIRTFMSRSKKPSTRWVTFGDCGAGTAQQAEIAFHAYNRNPQFLLMLGDNVYSGGLEREYRARFFPFYAANIASVQKGAPFLQTIPFYMLVGNHDVQAWKLDSYPDGLAYFYYNDLPLNAPIPEYTVEAKGSPATIKAFEKATEGRYPGIANYSFDYGNCHFVCLDANAYTNTLDPKLIEWLRNDLSRSKADWKIVAYHQPGFNSSGRHYDYQSMRLLSPFLEEWKVDLVLTGHVHNYQRSVPLKFDPKRDSTGQSYMMEKSGRVDGKFKLDTKFDGVVNTKPDGIIYIVSGAGGAVLYDTEISGKPEMWKHEPASNWVPFTVKIISDVHSYTYIETEGKKLTFKQYDVKDNEIDSIVITK